MVLLTEAAKTFVAEETRQAAATVKRFEAAIAGVRQSAEPSAQLVATLLSGVALSARALLAALRSASFAISADRVIRTTGRSHAQREPTRDGDETLH